MPSLGFPLFGFFRPRIPLRNLNSSLGTDGNEKPACLFFFWVILKEEMATQKKDQDIHAEASSKQKIMRNPVCPFP